MKKGTITSGMRPTGSLHLGNILGALDNWVKLQDDYDCYYFIVDWHSLTTPGGRDAVGYENIDRLPENIREMAIDWISAGLDPNKSVLFVQSTIPEVAELHLILSMVTPYSWLERNPTYREMVENLKIEHPSYGLLGYPVLQTADILAYKGTHVPVGKDQEAHINLARDIAKRFNSLYGKKVFPSPEIKFTEIPRVPGIDGIDKKMGKSFGNYIALSHTEEQTTELIRQMYTDPLKIHKIDKGHPDGCVVYTFHTIYSKEEEPQIRSDCENGKIGCVDCKMKLAEHMNSALRDIRAMREDLEKDPSKIAEILAKGTEKARKVAQATLKEVKEVMNIGYI